MIKRQYNYFEIKERKNEGKIKVWRKINEKRRNEERS